ncbi:MAG TPA: MtrB/PioB family decaheme-associated outer membrane protein [Rhodocyclaceae bacterium]|nr:MtrB/PioB family decaheme-associated outer membrane protein [Rhodocyclaceae bacterium]
MNTTQHVFRRTAVSAALLTIFGSAAADDAKIEELTKPESSISVGVGNWSGDRPQQGIYDGMRNNGTYGLFDADVNKRDDATGTWLTFKALNLGLETREFRGDYLRQGGLGGFFEYGKTLRENPYTINTGLQGIGTTNLTTGTNVSSFQKTNVDIGTTREMIRAGGFVNIMPGLDAKLDFKTEDKTGTRQAGWGSAPLFSVEPIDSTTRQLDAILQYTGERLQLSGGYSGSWYDNNNSQILQQLSGVTTGGTASFSPVTPMSLPLSNAAQQIFLDGGYGFTAGTRGNFKLAYTQATQDENLPSHSLGGVNAPYVNAPSHLDGKVDTTLAQMGLSSRFTSNLSMVANLRYYDVKDKTPVAGYVGGASGATVYNTPHSYSKTSGKLEGTYRLPANFNVTGGVDYEGYDRSYPTVGNVYVPFRATTNETTYRAELRRSMSETVNGAFAYFHSNRDGSEYVDASGTFHANQINPMHIADRVRDKFRVKFNWDPLEKLSLQARVDYSQDTYDDNGRAYGLKEGNSQVYALDAGWTFSDDWQFTAWYSHDVTDARHVSVRADRDNPNPEAIKTANLKDTGDSVGMGLRGKLTSKLEGGLGLDWFGSASHYPQDIDLLGTSGAYPSGAGGALPDVKSTLMRINLNAKYALDKRSDLRFDVIYERWHTNDSTWNFSDGSPFAYYSGTQSCGNNTPCNNGYTGVVDGTTVTAKETQISTFVGVRYIYKF